tara:strand:- start:2195 stop:2560 length:366 start_codon:yes stop_codon:yes gene_type:complete
VSTSPFERAIDKHIENTQQEGKDDLSRDVLIHICRDGTLTYRTRDEAVFNGAALPAFSVNSKKEAKSLIVLVGVAQHSKHPLLPNDTWYTYPGFGGEIEDIASVAAHLRKCYYSFINKLSS